MTVELIEDEVIVRLPKFMDFEAMQKMIDLISLKEIAARSAATQEEIDVLADEVNKGWWEKNRNRYLK
jgi:uncharacterized small protein (DUF1192 family)